MNNSIRLIYEPTMCEHITYLILYFIWLYLYNYFYCFTLGKK